MTDITVDVYDYDPYSDFPQSGGSFFNYVGPGAPETTIDITDNQSGGGDQTLVDHSSGSGETATGTITINGDTSTHSRIQAEDAWTVRDTVTGKVFQVVTLVVDDGAAAGYYMISEHPLVAGRTYEMVEYSSRPDTDDGDPVFTYSDYVCFAPDTQILTPDGHRKIQDLSIGDRVETLDNGAQKIVWVGSRKVVFDATDHPQRPILISAHALGHNLPTTDLVVSPQHRVLVNLTSSDQPHETLCKAKHLLHVPGVRIMKGKQKIIYHTLMTDRHEVLFAESLAVESFYPGPCGLGLLYWVDRLSIQIRYPGITQSTIQAYGPLARRSLKRKEIKNRQRVTGYGLPFKETNGDGPLAWRENC